MSEDAACDACSCTRVDLVFVGGAYFCSSCIDYYEQVMPPSAEDMAAYAASHEEGV